VFLRGVQRADGYRGEGTGGGWGGGEDKNTFSDVDKCITSVVVSNVVIIYCCVRIPYYKI